jgi:transposase
MKGSVMKQSKTLDFKGQNFFLGIDVSGTSWDVSIGQGHIRLKEISIDPSPKILADYMKTHYPGGTYYSVYEAGFSGFWAHRQLIDLGFHNIVTHAADVPTSDKERRHKNDRIDGNKLRRELANYSLKGIYVPSAYHEALRSLVHLRERATSHQTRLQNRIKMSLYQYGREIPPHRECPHWSRRFIKHLQQLSFEEPLARITLDQMLHELDEARHNVLSITRRLRQYARESQDRQIITNLMTVAGVGFVTAITFYAVICDMRRFPSFDHLASFVGLIPSEHSTGAETNTTGITPRRDRKLRYLLIEAAWTAIRVDPALLMVFNELRKRMDSKKAIIHIAKKLVSRMRYVWLNNKPYVFAVIE